MVAPVSGFVWIQATVDVPLTWTIALAGIEGVVRLCAAFSDSVLGIFPLYLLETIYSKIFRRGAPEPAGAVKFSQSHVASYVRTMREKVMSVRLTQVPDELCVVQSQEEELLEIRAWRGKPDWEPPRIVRYGDRYYRLEECAKGSGPRPFIYRLRKLSKGCRGAPC